MKTKLQKYQRAFPGIISLFIGGGLSSEPQADILSFSGGRTSLPPLVITHQPKQSKNVKLPPPSIKSIDLTEVAQSPDATEPGEIKLARIDTVGWVIMVYEDAAGNLTPARVINTDGDVVAVDTISESTVVWVAIDDDSQVTPLQKESTGSLTPARADPNGTPILPESIDIPGRVFIAQLSEDGALLPIIRRTDQGVVTVRVSADGTITRIEKEPASVREEEPVQEEGQFSGSLSFNNSGSGETGPQTVTALGTYSKLFNEEDALTLGATTSASHPDQYQSIFGTYGIAVKGLVEEIDDRFTLSGYYYDIDYDNTVPNQPNPAKFAINGYAISPSYTQYLHFSESESGAQSAHALNYTVTFDRYYTRNFGQGQDSRTSLVRIPASIAYSYLYASDTVGLVRFRTGYTRNINFGSANDGDDYRTNRTRADPRFDKLNAFLFHEKSFENNWLISTTLNAQYARDPLISAEGFSLGGEGSVRGLEFARTVGDTGATGQFELVTPDLVPSDALDTYLVSFVDVGWADLRQPNTTTVGSESAVGIGGGLRVRSDTGFYANFFAGWLAAGSAVERYGDEDGRYQLYFNGGVDF